MLLLALAMAGDSCRWQQQVTVARGSSNSKYRHRMAATSLPPEAPNRTNKVSDHMPRDSDLTTSST